MFSDILSDGLSRQAGHMRVENGSANRRAEGEPAPTSRVPPDVLSAEIAYMSTHVDTVKKRVFAADILSQEKYVARRPVAHAGDTKRYV